MTRSAMQMGRLTLVVCLLLLLLLTTQACFVRDCPDGGKRDVDDRAERQCMSCSFGQCVGPHICCGDNGCEMGTPEANTCHEEDENPIPCHVVGDPCILNNPGNIHGKCVSTGLCCVDDTCAIDFGCL